MKATIARACQIALMFVFAMTAQSPSPIIIVNKNNPVTSVTKAQIKKILTGAQTKWPGGEKIVVLLPDAGSPERKGALSTYCGMTEQQLNADLIHASFVGEERVRPKTMPNTKAIVTAVEQVAGAVGVVGEGDVTDQVKTLTIE